MAHVSFSPRVLHVIPSISPKRGGPSEAILPMVRELNECGARAEIATTNDDGPGTTQDPLDTLTCVAGVPVRFFPRFSPPTRAIREYAYSRTFSPWLRKHVRDYDLIHVHALFSYLSTVAMSAAIRSGVPHINRPLGQLGRWPLRQSAGRKKLYYHLWEARHLRGAAALHFASEAEQIEASVLGLPTRAAIIPHGMALAPSNPTARQDLRTHLGLPPGQKILLFLSRVHPKKGLDLLLPAFAALQNPGITLLLAGEGEPRHEHELSSLIRHHGLEHKVIRAGFVFGERKQLFLQGADIFVLPSRHENFGIAVLESLAAGTPVLISDRVPLADVVRKFGFGEVVPLHVEAVRQGLQKLLDRPPQGKAEELRAFLATHYSWRANAVALLKLYATILAPTTRSATQPLQESVSHPSTISP